MTVEELIKELKKYPKTAKIVAVMDWKKTDNEGRSTECKEFEETSFQTWYADTGFSKDYTEVLVC